MKSFRVVVSRVIAAPPDAVYRVISDMDEHRKILPKEFESVIVETGGKGAGTVVRVNMNVMGTRVTNVLTITEPEPGRVMREVDPVAGVDTTWTLTPLEGGTRCDLKLDSVFRSKPGFAGLMERLFSPSITRSIYRRELELLNAYVLNVPH